MDFNALRKKNNNCDRSVDRFIFHRATLEDMRTQIFAEMSMDPQAGRDKTVDIWTEKHLQRKKYVEYLDELRFDLKTPKSVLESGRTAAWPCVPRVRRHLSSADNILDLPTYRNSLFPDVLDWSSKDVLVAALGNKYYTWSWKSQDLIGHGITYTQIHCCKFDPEGDLLALGTSCSTIELHDVNKSKRIRNTYCCRHNFSALVSPVHCEVTALHWSPTGAAFATGCNHGIVTSFTRSGIRQHFAKVMEHTISIIRISPDARFLALASMFNKHTYITTWPELKKYAVMQNNHNHFVKQTLVWHPWRTALLAIGVMNANSTQVKIILFDAHPANMKELFLGQNYLTETGFILIDTMLFSPVTGELVLGLFRSEKEEHLDKTWCQLVVMSDNDTVTDVSDGRIMDRFRTMVFSPDGTKLATATFLEDLIIWNFLPEAKNKTVKKARRFSALPVYLDEFSLDVMEKR